MSAGIVAAAAPPLPAPLRFEDDHRALRQACADRRFPPCLKQHEVGDHVRLSVGGEWAARIEAQRNPRFGQPFDGSDAVTLQRAFAFADVEAGAHWRLFVQLYGTAAQGRRNGVTTVDRSGLEWQNAFLEWRTEGANHGLRLGEQELRFGNGRLIDAREGLNVRRRFSGARGWTTVRGWRVDAIDVRPRAELRDNFDDRRNPEQSLEGVIARQLSAGAEWGVYALWRDDAAAIGNEGPHDERRRTFALHHVGKSSGWEWNLEAIRQDGRAGSLTIDAHALFAEGDYGRADWPLGLRIGALMGVASGDRRRGDGRLGTFDPLYARGNLLDEDATLFPRNLRNLQATAEFVPAPGWFIQASAGTLWRDSLGDGVYRAGGRLLVDGGSSRERRVASTMSGFAERRWASGFSLLIRGSVLSPGPFLEDRGLDDTTLWSEVALRYRF
jgi:hypothetical protein